MKRISVLVFLFLLQIAFAAKNVVILEIVPSDNIAEEITVEESLYFAEELRRQAMMLLPMNDYNVLSRDSLVALLSTKDIDCLTDNCAVEIGRAIEAEYITQGRLGKFGKSISISVELFESKSRKLLSRIVFESQSLEGLLKAIREQAKPLFNEILVFEGSQAQSTEKPVAQPAEPIKQTKPTESTEPVKQVEPMVSGLNDSKDIKNNTKTPTSIPTNIKPEVKKPGLGAGFWVAIALDVIGAGLITYGVIKNKEALGFKEDYDNSNNQEDFDKYRKKADDAAKIRNIMYVSGGVALATGIGVHIWF